VAGPLYKISLYHASIRDERLGPIYALRKGDQLQEFYESFRQMYERLRGRTEQDVESLNQAIAAIEGAGAQGELGRQLEKLRTLRAEKLQSLEGQKSE
jgi:hypothetical protein